MKSVQIRSFFWSVFSVFGRIRKSPYSIRIEESTDQKKAPYLDTFHEVKSTVISILVHGPVTLSSFAKIF